MVSKKIVRRSIIQQEKHDLASIHPLLQRIYLGRNVNSLGEINRTLAQLLPFDTLHGIDKAVELLSLGITEQKKFLIVGDFDADGATSTALAMRALKSLGAEHIEFIVPNRFAFGYGLTPELVQHACKKNGALPDFIITVDNGIANHAGVLAAKALGIQVIITDHHLPPKTLPPADAIVNPNLPNDLFNSKNLAGVGVIFYVMIALRRYLIEQGWFEKKGISAPNMAKLLDLVALGTVADLVSLDHNNRILVHQGLERIRHGQCIPGIVALLELSAKDLTEVVASDLGFSVGARLNAAGRMDDMSIGIHCLLTDDHAEARRIAQILNSLNLERRTVEKEMQDVAIAQLEQLSLTKDHLSPMGICLFKENWHQGVIGILAARIKDRYHRPAIIFAPGVDDEIKGSARSIVGLHIRDVLAMIDVQAPGLILKYGGHAMAAGLTIQKSDFCQFAQLFDDTVKKLLRPDQLEQALLSDGLLDFDYFNLPVADLLRNAGPWGQAFPEPLFDDTFSIMEQRLIGEKHLKMCLQKNSLLLPAIQFFINLDCWPNHRCEKIHAAYRLDVNNYKGRRHLQLIIEHMEAV